MLQTLKQNVSVEILGPTDYVFIEQANDLHTGQYHCEAVNARGRDYLTYHIEVIGEIIV